MLENISLRGALCILWMSTSKRCRFKGGQKEFSCGLEERKDLQQIIKTAPKPMGAPLPPLETILCLAEELGQIYQVQQVAPQTMSHPPLRQVQGHEDTDRDQEIAFPQGYKSYAASWTAPYLQCCCILLYILHPISYSSFIYSLLLFILYVS